MPIGPSALAKASNPNFIIVIWFLDHIATHMLAFEGDSKVVWFEGNYSEYEADRKARFGAAAD
ncbi:MAG TPA: hypothetical protein ACFYD0_13495 [Candidatus Wunengus sp. YC65]|uniref:hypothetical protein n=1 Tax=Candidatus Wunengus sp. YC65 TaxID=3367701 RepID=UPI00402719F2